MNTLLNANIVNFTPISAAHDFFKSIKNRFWEHLNSQTYRLAYGLPNEIWVSIMLELKPYELLQLSMETREHRLLASDQVWQQLAAKQPLFVKQDGFSLHEFKLLANFQDLKYHFASVIGFSKFQLLVEQTNRLDIETPLAYCNYGKDVLKIRCREIASKKEFEMNIIGTKDSDFVNVNFRNLGGRSRHHSVELMNHF